MKKKSKNAKRKRQSSIQAFPVDRYIDLITQQMMAESYAEAIFTCERLLNLLPKYAPQRVDVLSQLGTSQAMLHNFPESFTILTEALTLAPGDADIWYNRGLACRYLSRFGQALKDIQRAVELNTNSEFKEQFSEELQFARQMADESMEMRGPDFTLDQLIEQENHFQDGLTFMDAGKWKQAEQAFQASIDMGDCLPQPWGNLGICLMMQERYDEAEAALKRALVIDPEYTLATNHLATLAKSRRSGSPAHVILNEPYKNSKLNQSITFVNK